MNLKVFKEWADVQSIDLDKLSWKQVGVATTAFLNDEQQGSQRYLSAIEKLNDNINLHEEMITDAQGKELS